MAEKKERFWDTGLHFSCTACGNCCQLDGGKVFLTEDEVNRAAEYLGMSIDEFIATYIRAIVEQESYVLRDGEKDCCIFLEDQKCNIYPVRPMQCRTFPFWPENVKSLYRWKIVAEDCPGIGQGRLYTAEEINDVLKNRKTVEQVSEEGLTNLYD